MSQVPDSKLSRIEAVLIKKLESSADANLKLGIAATAMIFIYQALFTIGLQAGTTLPVLTCLQCLNKFAVVWLIPSEILPLKIRSKGSSISTACNWIINYTIVQITPHAVVKLGWRFYLMFFILNLSFLPPIYLFIPETAGQSLESVDLLFSGKRDPDLSDMTSRAVLETSFQDGPCREASSHSRSWESDASTGGGINTHHENP